nr:GtrA family protein [Nocardioides sp. zg-1230]
MVSYGIFGGVGAMTDLGTYLVLVHGMAMPPVASNIVSVCCGIAVSFTLNSRFTFSRQDRRHVRLVRFFVVGLTGLAISTALLAVLVHAVHLAPFWAKLLTVPPVVLGQFLTNRSWTFAHLPGAERQPPTATDPHRAR